MMGGRSLLEYVSLILILTSVCHGKVLMRDEESERKPFGEYDPEQYDMSNKVVSDLPTPTWSRLQHDYNKRPILVATKLFGDLLDDNNQRQFSAIIHHQDKINNNNKRVTGDVSNYLLETGQRVRPASYNLRSYSSPGFSSVGVGGGGRHTSGFLPRKRQILFRQCFFNPISCF